MPFNFPLSSEYQSPMPFGRFHASLTSNGRLNVTVRVNWRFNDTSPKVTDAPWNPGSIATYKQALAQNVAATWNRKWKLRCTAGGYQGVYEPYFTIVDGTEHNRHFEILVDNQHGGSGLWLDGRLQLFKYDVVMYDDIPGQNKFGMSRGGVYESEMTKLRALMQDVATIRLVRGPGGGTAGTWTVAPGDLVHLRAFAHGLAALGDLATHIPITIHATSGAAGKAAALVAEVRAEIARNGVNPDLYHFETDATKTWAKWRKPFKAHKTEATVRVDMREDLMAGLNAWRYEYRVGDHEFGHCLGLPDEYKIYDPTSALGPAHQRWVALCGRAAVAANPYPASEQANLFNRSLMSAGWVTAACHYVTLWDAVTQMTARGPYNIAPGDWVIERGTETASL